MSDECLVIFTFDPICEYYNGGALFYVGFRGWSTFSNLRKLFNP
jgi:hypothetical protein